MATPSTTWEANEYCYLTTVGRVTGNPHRIEIWFVVDGDSVWLLTERAAETHWVKNLRVNPTVTLEVGELTMEADAEVVANLPADAPLRARLASRYSPSPDGDNLESWAAGALAVRITPH
jgi:deazaflavin-dependent oxidoreductase (nitroreductase family)